MTTHSLASIIDAAFERRADITPQSVPQELAHALDQVLAGLNTGHLRVALVPEFDECLEAARRIVNFCG